MGMGVPEHFFPNGILAQAGRPEIAQNLAVIQQKQAGTAVCAHNGGQISHNAPTESQQKHNRNNSVMAVLKIPSAA